MKNYPSLILDIGESVCKVGFSNEWLPRLITSVRELRDAIYEFSNTLNGRDTFSSVNWSRGKRFASDHDAFFCDCKVKKQSIVHSVLPEKDSELESLSSVVAHGRTTTDGCINYQVSGLEPGIYKNYIRALFNYIFVDTVPFNINNTDVFLLVNPYELKSQQLNIIANFLFKIFRIKSLVLLSNFVAPLYVLPSIHTGLLIDVGYSSTRIVAVYDYRSIFNTYSSFPSLSIHRIHLNLLHLILEDNLNIIWTSFEKFYIEEHFNSDTHHFSAMGKSVLRSRLYAFLQKFLDDILVRCCYLRRYATNLDISSRTFICASEDEIYVFDSPFSFFGFEVSSIMITKKTRWKATELLFGGFDIVDGCHTNSLVSYAVRTLEKLDVLTKGSVIQNIFCFGGGAHINGFFSRFSYELSCEMDEVPSLQNLSEVTCIAFPHVPPVIRAWNGACVFVNSVDEPKKVYTAADFDEGKLLSPENLFPSENFG